MCPRSIESAFRRFAICVLVTVTGAWSAPADAGKLARSGVSVSSRVPEVATTAAKSTVAVGEVVEFYNAGLDHYFITANPAEQAVVDSGVVGVWRRTGNTFPAGGTSDVCRFYGSLAPGPNSHFFTANAAECADLKRLQTITPASQKRWNFEGNDFLTTPAVNGACPAGLLPVYRAYNNGFARGIDSNHRITSNQSDYLHTVATGWIGEGVVMCAPLPQATLPLQFAACSESDCPIVTTLGNGPYLVNVIVEITNSGATPIELVIPAGQTFIASPAIYQDGIAMQRLAATIAPGTTGRFVLFLYCIELAGDGSNTGTTYKIGPITTNVQLLDLISLATDKLGASRDPSHIKSDALQLAVWEITDGAGVLSVLGRNLLVALLDTVPGDAATQAAIYAQFKATLTIRTDFGAM
jgi:hypothetical protein